MAFPVKRISAALVPLALLAALIAAWVAADSVPLAPDAAVREALGRRMILQTTEGRQGLVSSLWFAPLPTLLRLPFVYLLPDSLAGLPSRLVSLLAALAALAALARAARRWLPGPAAALIVLGLAGQPAFLQAALDGGDATTIAFLVLLGAASWVRWVLEDRLTHLVLLSLAAALLALTRVEMLAWAAAGFVAVVVHEIGAPRLPGQRQAILVLGLLPWAYGFGLWLLGNWLIMGDALYFLRPLSQLRPAAEAASAISAELLRHPAWLLPALFPALLAMAALVRREGASLALALLAAAAATLAAALHALGCLWDPHAFLIPFLALCLLALARFAALLPATRRTAAAALAPAAILALFLFFPNPAPNRPLGPPPDSAELRAMRDEIRARVLAQSPFARVYVCGYDSFLALRGDDGTLFLHELDFDFTRARQDYEGHDLFLLIPRPEGRAATESIHRKFPGIFATGHANTLHTGDWGRWRLFELIDQPREEL